MQQTAADYLARTHRRRTWKTVISVLACIVVFCTTYALILPAITMTDNNQVLDCSINIHQHTADCYDDEYNLICGEADFVIHTHDSSCFDAEGNLVCKLPEIEAHEHTNNCCRKERKLICTLQEDRNHEHTDDCYTKEQGALICTNEDSDHEHADECYEWNEILTCNQEAGEGGHTHTDDCYVIADVLICDNPAVLHRHTADCYDAAGNLICGQLEVLEHIHGNGCFKELKPDGKEIVAGAHLVPAENTCFSIGKATSFINLLEEDHYDPALDTPTDLKPFVESVEIQRRAPGDTLWVDLVDNNVNEDDELSFKLNYVIDAGTLSADHRRVIYTVGLRITATEATYGDVVDDNDANKTIGKFEIDTSGHIIITFNKDVAEGNETQAIQGHINFHAAADALQRDEDDENTVTFTDELIIHIKKTTGDLDVKKVSENVDTVGGTLDYKITVSSEHGTHTQVLLMDVMEEVGIDITENPLTITRTNKNDEEINETLTPGDYTKSLGSGRFELELPPMKAGDIYTITYPAKTTSSPPVTTIYKATNTVKVESTNSAGTPVTDSAATADYFTRKLVSKSGEWNESTGEITWTLLVNSNYFKNSDGEYERVNLAGWTLSDWFVSSDGAKIEYTGGATITPNPEPNAETDSLTVDNLPYTFPEGCPSVEYTVTYTPSNGSADTQNQAILTPPEGNGTASETTPVKPGSYSISKDALGFSSLGMVNGEMLLQEDWEITVDATGGAISPAYKMPILGTKSADWSQDENNCCWYLTDILDTSDHYFTPQQLKDLTASVTEAIQKTSYSGNYYVFASTGGMALNVGDNVVLLARNEGSYDGWQDNEKEPDESIKYKRFFVIFDGDLGPGKGQSLTFRYSTTTSVGDGSANATRSNQVTMIIASDNRPNASATQLYKPVVRKSDARGSTSEYIYGSDDLNFDKTTGETYGNVLRWMILVNFPDQEYKDDVVITETLPEGLELLQYTQSNKNYGLYANFGIKTYTDVFQGGSAYLDADGGRNHTYSSQKGNLICTEDGVCENSWTVNGVTYTVTYKRLGNNQYQVIVPKELANAVRGGSGRIYVNARIPNDSWTGIEHEFTNEVKVRMEGTTETASHTQTVRRPVVEKSSSYTSGRIIPYTILINQEGADLLPGGDKLTLTDVLSYKTEAGLVNAVLDYKNITVTDLDGSPVEFTYQMARNTLADGTATRTLTMTIPDSTPLKVSYQYRLRGDGVISDVKNQATVSDSYGDSASSEHKLAEEMTIQDADAGGSLESGITVHKRDQSDYGVPMQGIRFQLQKYNDETKAWDPVMNPNDKVNGYYTTNDRNEFIIMQELTPNVVYRLYEVETPEGYEVLNPNDYAFYISGTAADAPPVIPPELETAPRQLSRDDEITVENIPTKPEGYELPQTGGAGTTLYTIGGLLLVAGAAILLMYKYIKCRKEDSASS